MTMQLINKQSGEVINADMFFLNEYSDGGSASLQTTIDAIKEDYTIVYVENGPITVHGPLATKD